MSAVPVALKLTGDPVSPADVARKVLAPAVVPSVAVVETVPSAALVVLIGLTLPPPANALQVTAVPLTGLLYWSVTFATSSVGSAVPTVAVCGLPLT